ncbi:MAG: HAMP domain-containing histidine kinase [Myxococcota bacterium]|nr:HAMP domain-containing histidine kinase [Myxococcota bacterium]
MSRTRLAEAIGLHEVSSEAFRPKLLAGIFTGYVTAALLLVLVIVARAFDALPGGDWPFALVAIKAGTNTLAAISWRTRKWVLGVASLNIAADVLVMTGAIYFTGGILSPLVAIYFVEIAVMALLTNVGLTITTVVGCVAMYSAMAILVHTGVLDAVPPPVSSPSEVTTAMVATMLAFVALVTFAPGIYVAMIVERLRNSERKLAARADELLEAGRAKSEFTANITHELRTPLHGILGMGELLEDGVYGPISAKQTEIIRTMRGSATGLLELIDSLLVLARAEALRLEIREAPVDVAEVVASVVATGRMLVGRRTLDVAAIVEDGLPIVHTDRQKLVQILVNLLANAIKFTPDEGSVRIEAAAEDGGVRIAVRDTGRGVPKGELARIFEPYFQVDGSPVREHGGAGIGLSVVRTLADRLGLTVAVESELGSGCTFTLTIPRAPTTA